MDQLMVSVLIPVYNTEKYLRESLDSMKNQTLKELEVICVDDGSTDSSPQILKEFAAADPRFRIFRQNNLGPSDARNWAVRESRGKYLYFMDSDDILELDALRQAVDYAEKNALDLVCFDAEPFAVNNECPEELEMFRNSYRRRFDYPGICSGPQMLMRMQNNNDIVVAPWASMLRRELFIPNAMWYYPRIAHADVSYSFLAYLSARRAGYMKKIFFHRRVRPGSIMTGSKLSHHSWSYFCGCKLMTERLRSFKLTPQEMAAAVRYIQVRLTMAQRYYLQMNGQERQACIALTGTDAPLYKQMVAEPAEATLLYFGQKKRRELQAQRFRKAGRSVRVLDRMIGTMPAGKQKMNAARTGIVKAKQTADGERPAKAAAEHTEEQTYQDFCEAVEILSNVENVTQADEQYAAGILRASEMIGRAAEVWETLPREERGAQHMDEGTRQLFSMLVSQRAQLNRMGKEERNAANDLNGQSAALIRYLEKLSGSLSGPVKTMCEGIVKKVSEPVPEVTYADILAEEERFRNSLVNKLPMRPVRAMMLGYYGLRSAVTFGWRRDWLRALSDWNTSEEYGAGVMVRYQGIRSGMGGSSRKQTFDFRTAGMRIGADEYDYFAKDIYKLSGTQKRRVPTGVTLRYLVNRTNVPASVLQMKASVKALPRGTAFGSLLTEPLPGEWRETLRICTVRRGTEITPEFAALILQKPRQKEQWIAAVNPVDGCIGKPKGSLGGRTEAPDLTGKTLNCRECALALCIAGHEKAPFGAELLVWDIRMLDGQPIITAAGNDIRFVDCDAEGNTLLPKVEQMIREAKRNEITLSAPVIEGNTVSCSYTVTGPWSAIFPENNQLRLRYDDMDPASVPAGILVIPFLAQILPAAWVCHAQVRTAVCDKAWMDCLKSLAVSMKELYPAMPTANSIMADRLTENPSSGNHCAVLFKKPLDARYSACLHSVDHPVILTTGEADRLEAVKLGLPVKNAEILQSLKIPELLRMTDNAQWLNDFLPAFEQLGAAIPMAWQLGAESLYVSSTDPSFDSRIRFGTGSVIYDGFGYTDEEKLQQIAAHQGYNGK